MQKVAGSRAKNMHGMTHGSKLCAYPSLPRLEYAHSFVFKIDLYPCVIPRMFLARDLATFIWIFDQINFANRDYFFFKLRVIMSCRKSLGPVLETCTG